jgi:zinc protease
MSAKKATSKRPATPPKSSPVDRPTATVETLDNGLEVIVQEDHANPLATVQLWVRAGSIHEEGWTGAGLAHLTEHMMFKGTATRTAQQLSQSIQQLGGYVNAYTSFNRTVYYIDGLADKAEGYMEILADMALRSKFDPDELEREKDVIRREMAMDNDDADSTGQHLLQQTAFKTHPLRHPIIGHRQVFDQVKHADLLAFVRRHYSPNNCFLVVTGDVETSAIVEQARRYFGEWVRQPYGPVMLPAEVVQKGPRKAKTSFATELTRMTIGWPIPGDAHGDKPALDVLGFLLGSGRSSRLYRELREKRGIAHSVWAGAFCAVECGLFSMDAECDPEDANKALVAMKEVVALMQAKGPSKAELDKAVRSTVASQLRSMISTKGQAGVLGHGWLSINSLDYTRIYLAAIRALTIKDIQRVAQSYLIEATSNEVIVEPIVEKAKAKSVTTKSAKSVDMQKITLSNGLTVLLGANTRLPLVSMRASFLSGVLLETDETAGITQVTAQMMMKGTKKLDAHALGEVLESRGGMVQTSGDAHRLWVAADTMAEDQALGLEVLTDLLLNPTLPANQLALVQKRQIASIREEAEDPLTVALRKVRREIFTGTQLARTALGTEQSVPKLKVGDCRDVLKNGLVGANSVISMVGDFDLKEARKKIESTLGKLPKGRRALGQYRELPHNGKPGTWELKMDKEQAVLVVGYRSVGLHHKDSYVLSMIDVACSDMGSRLFNRIREELGLAYYVGAQSFMAYGAGSFNFYVGTDAAKIDLAQKEMQKQISDLAKNGLQAAELDRAKITWRANWLRSQQGNGPIADGRAWDELNGLGLDHFHRLPSIVEAITLDDVKRVAKTYLKDAYIVRVMPKV